MSMMPNSGSNFWLDPITNPWLNGQNGPATAGANGLAGVTNALGAPGPMGATGGYPPVPPGGIGNPGAPGTVPPGGYVRTPWGTAQVPSQTPSPGMPGPGVPVGSPQAGPGNFRMMGPPSANGPLTAAPQSSPAALGQGAQMPALSGALLAPAVGLASTQDILGANDPRVLAMLKQLNTLRQAQGMPPITPQQAQSQPGLLQKIVQWGKQIMGSQPAGAQPMTQSPPPANSQPTAGAPTGPLMGAMTQAPMSPPPNAPPAFNAPMPLTRPPMPQAAPGMGKGTFPGAPGAYSGMGKQGPRHFAAPNPGQQAAPSGGLNGSGPNLNQQTQGPSVIDQMFKKLFGQGRAYNQNDNNTASGGYGWPVGNGTGY